MNIIDQLIERIEDYRKENKNPCKSYKTKAAAEKATKEVAEMVGREHLTEPARYVVFFNEAWGRWCGAVDLQEVIARNDATGGYLGLAGSRGFYTY